MNKKQYPEGTEIWLRSPKKRAHLPPDYRRNLTSLRIDFFQRTPAMLFTLSQSIGT